MCLCCKLAGQGLPSRLRSAACSQQLELRMESGIDQPTLTVQGVEKAPNDWRPPEKVVKALSETGSVMAASPLEVTFSGDAAQALRLAMCSSLQAQKFLSAGRPLHALQRCQSLNTSLHKRALRKLLSARFKQLRLRTIRQSSTSQRHPQPRQ